MLITAQHVDEAVAAGRSAVPIPAGAVITPAAKDRARELGVSLARGNGSVVVASAAAARPQAAPPPMPAMPAGGGPIHEIDIKPNYFPNPAMDNLFTIVLELGAALWVVKDRVRVMEELMTEHGHVTTEMIELYRPTPEKQKEVLEERNAFIDRIYGIIKDNPG